MAKLGTVFVELTLDDKVYKQKLSEIPPHAEATAKGIETAWRALGTKSDAVFDQQRKSAENAYTLIKNSALSSTQDIARAKEASAAKIKQIDEQQHGTSTSMIDKLKAHWIAATVAIGAAIALISKAWSMAEAGAAYIEQMQLLNALARQYDMTAQQIVSAMQEAGQGMIDMGAAAEIAAGALARGITPEQLTNLSKAAAVMHDFMGVKTDQALKMFVSALETGRTRSITAAVGVKAVGEASDEMIGKMTGAEKATMGYNAIMAASAEVSARLGNSTASIDDKMEKFHVTLKNLNIEMGILVVKAGAGLVAAFQYLAAGVLGLAAAYFRANSAISGFLGQSEKAATMAANAAAATEARNNLLKESAANFAIMTASTAELTAATGRGAANTEAHALSAKAQAENLKASMKAMTDMIPVMAKTGEEQLKFAKTGFDESLKKEGVILSELKDGLATYMTALQEVYTARIEGEKAIEEAMKKAGGKPEEAMKAQLEALKQEKEHLIARQAGWKSYYDTLSGLHSKATDLMKTKSAELQKLEESAAAQRMSYAMQMMALQEKLYVAQGLASTDLVIREMKLIALAQERAAANQLTGEAQIKALESVQKKYGELTDQVTTEGKKYDETTGTWVKTLNTVVTAEDSIKEAMSNVNSVQGDINRATEQARIAKKKEIETLADYKSKITAAMEEAKAQMGAYQEKIIAVSTAISKIERDIAIKITMSPGIMQEVQALNAALDAATRPRTVQVSVVKIESSASSGGGSAPTYTNESGTYDYGYSGPEMTQADLPGGDFATGLNYVPRDNFPAKLHEGEAVLTKEEASTWRKGGSRVININLSSNIIGANKSPEQLAREIVKPLQSEMRRLAVVN